MGLISELIRTAATDVVIAHGKRGIGLLNIVQIGQLSHSGGLQAVVPVEVIGDVLTVDVNNLDK